MARPRQISDEEILEGVRECVFHHGSGVSTLVMARSVGLSQAALFKRFKCKENLLICALVPPVHSEWLVRAQEGPHSHCSIQEQMTELGLLGIAHFRMMMPRLMALREAGITIEQVFARFEVPPPVAALLAMQRWFLAAADQGQISCESAETTAMAFIGGLHMRVFFDVIVRGEKQVVGPVASDREYVENLVNNLWLGLASERSQ